MQQRFDGRRAVIDARDDERGALLTEYLLLATLVAIVVMVAVMPIGPALSQMIADAVAAF